VLTADPGVTSSPKISFRISQRCRGRSDCPQSSAGQYENIAADIKKGLGGVPAGNFFDHFDWWTMNYVIGRKMDVPLLLLCFWRWSKRLSPCCIAPHTKGSNLQKHSIPLAE
jgi:hypothetical protein